MKFDFLSKIDLSVMDEVSVKSLQALQDAINATVGDFMDDTIDKKTFEDKLNEVSQKIDSEKELETVRKELGEMKEIIVRMVSVSAILSCRPFFILIFLPYIKMRHYGFSRKSIWKNLETFP